MMEVVSDDYWSYKTCKAPVKSSPSTNQHPTFDRPDALCGLRGCKYRPAQFPGQMSYKTTRPGLVLFYILACFNCIVAH